MLLGRVVRPRSRRDEPLGEHPQPPRRRQQRRAQDAPDAAGRQKAEAIRGGYAPAAVPHERPPHLGRHAHERVGQADPRDHVDDLGPGREEGVRRPFDQPAVLPAGSQHAAGPPRRVDDGDLPVGLRKQLCRREPGHACPEDDGPGHRTVVHHRLHRLGPGIRL